MLSPWLYRRDDQPPELQPLPRHCFHNLFEEGQQLLQLTELVVDGLSIEEMEGWVEWVQVRPWLCWSLVAVGRGGVKPAAVHSFLLAGRFM
jgi:hypothetical protein